jgi:hypothetical protein
MGVLGQSRDQGRLRLLPMLSGPGRQDRLLLECRGGLSSGRSGPHSTRVGEAIYEKRTYDQIIKALQAEGEQGEDTLTITHHADEGQAPVPQSLCLAAVGEPAEPDLQSIHGLYGGGDRPRSADLGRGKAGAAAQAGLPQAFPNEGALVGYTGPARQQKQVIAALRRSLPAQRHAGKRRRFIGGMGGSVAFARP